MRFAVLTIAAVLAVTSFDGTFNNCGGGVLVSAKSSRGSSASRGGGRSGSRGGGGGGDRSGGGGRGGPPPTSRRRAPAKVDDYDDDEEEEGFGDFGFPGDDEEDEADEGYDSDVGYDDEEEEMAPPPRRGRGGPPPQKGGRGPRSRGPPPPRRAAPQRYEEEDDYDAYDDEEEYEERRPSRGGRGGPPPRGASRGGPPPRGSSRGGRSTGGASRRGGGGERGGRVVPYSRGGRGARQPQPGAFTRGLTALRESIPAPTAVKDAAVAAASAARETTSKLSANVYREVKGLTSSELEQVMLKATKPDDTPVKGKHVERLVGVTYQISGRYDIYDAVLRKLWAKMTEKDWRTKSKSLYILHRFSSDGAPDHQAALKARLRELRRTRDPKRKEKYFNSKQLLGGDASPDDAKYRAFLARYAHYVLLRVQCFGGMFNEISEDPSKAAGGGKKGGRAPPTKPLTATALRPEHLEAAQMILKAGCACTLRDGEACENTAFCVERVAADLVGLVGAVSSALNRCLKNDGPSDGSDPAVVAQWCEFYADELLPKAKRMIKETSPQLDAYGLFLPSRMGTSVSQELLRRGLKGVEAEEEDEEASEEEEEESPAAVEAEKEEKAAPERSPKKAAEKKEARKPEPPAEDEEEQGDEDEEEYDEYEYEEEEYYDDEEA